jgi:hypothetical protein
MYFRRYYFTSNTMIVWLKRHRMPRSHVAALCCLVRAQQMAWDRIFVSIFVIDLKKRDPYVLTPQCKKEQPNPLMNPRNKHLSPELRTAIACKSKHSTQGFLRLIVIALFIICEDFVNRIGVDRPRPCSTEGNKSNVSGWLNNNRSGNVPDWTIPRCIVQVLSQTA